MTNPITFDASIPPIMSGIKTGGDGARVQFDIPESDMLAVLALIAMKGKRLEVTVKAVDVEKHKPQVNY